MLGITIYLFMIMILVRKMKSVMLMMIMSMIIFMFKFNSNMIIGIGMGMGIDKLSGLLIMMSMLILYLMCLSSNKVWEHNENYYMFMYNLLSMNMILFLVFSSMNTLMFFFWFELILVPMFLMIMGWGSQSERFNASMYMMFYTLFGSLPLILGLVYMYSSMNMNFFMMSMYMEMKLWSIIFLMAFLIKLPMFFFHYWLPKAHVEAPVAGSMILAGVLLKLGGYGIYRFYMMMGKSIINNYLVSIGLLGGLFSSFLCLRQIDIKSLIAYSSIGHMGLLLSGFMSGGKMGYDGGVVMMIGHGLCSSGMFAMMNIMYERINSRSLVIMRGLLMINPSMLFWLFMMLSSNMSAPPSLNLMSELMLMGNMVFYEKSMMILLFMMFMVSCGYSLYLFSMVQHNFYWNTNKMYPMNQREMVLMMMHWVPLNILFMKM